MKVHFYHYTEFPIRYWHPLDLLGVLFYKTIFRGEPAHCNVEDNGVFYDYALHCGARTMQEYPGKPMKTIEIDGKCGEFEIFCAGSLANHKQALLPVILEVLGIWPTWKSSPLTCVSLTCIMLGERLHFRRPIHLLKSLENVDLQITGEKNYGRA